MLQQTLGSGWGGLIPGVIVAGLGFAGLSEAALRGLIVLGLLLSCAMIWHRQLRHFVLLPSVCALTGGILLVLMNAKLLG